MGTLVLNLLLDTSVFRSSPRRHATFVSVPVIVLGELHSGFQAGTRRLENEELLRRFLNQPSVQVVDVTAETAVRYGEIDVLLRQKGRPIPRIDVWIAAVAMEHGMRLLTLVAHFREIPLLPIEPLPH